MADFIEIANQNSAWNAAEAQKNRDFQAKMSNTAHQREVKDLVSAGLNPVLSANAGASTPTGSQAQADTSANSAIASVAAASISAGAMVAAAQISADASITNTKISAAKDIVNNRTKDWKNGLLSWSQAVGSGDITPNSAWNVYGQVQEDAWKFVNGF